MAGKSKAARTEAKRLAHENLERLAGGTVTLFLWPTKLSDRDVPREETDDGWVTRPEYKTGGRVYCSPRCIMRSQGFDFHLSLIEQEENEDLLEDDDTIRVKRGTWPLSRYLVRKHYRADVAHFTCRHCHGPLRQALTPTKRRQKEKLRKARANTKRKAKERAKLAGRNPWVTIAQIRAAEREVAEKRRDRAAAQRARRAKGKLTPPERVAAAKARKLMEDKRRSDFKRSDEGIRQALDRQALRRGLRRPRIEEFWPDHWLDSFET